MQTFLHDLRSRYFIDAFSKQQIELRFAQALSRIMHGICVSSRMYVFLLSIHADQGRATRQALVEIINTEQFNQTIEGTVDARTSCGCNRVLALVI